jgi:hypothetical protein
MRRLLIGLAKPTLSMAMASVCAACGGFQHADRDGDTAVLKTNAEHRVVLSSAVDTFSRPGLVDPVRITCTEPSPDVAMTVSKSAAAALSIPTKGSATLSSTQAQGLVQLAERTAALQLLSQKMYQACLAYKNGAITGTTYTLLMSRLDDAIVTTQATDAAVGAFGRAGAAVTGSAQGGASATAPIVAAGLARLEEGVAAVQKADSELTTARATLAAAEANCQAAKTADPAAGGESAACKTAAETSGQVATLEAAQKTRLALLKDQATATTTAASKVDEATGVGALTPAVSSATVRYVRDMQEQFVTRDASTEVISACLVELGLDSGPPDTAGRLLDQYAASVAAARGAVRDAESPLPNGRARPAGELDAARRRLSEAERTFTSIAPQVAKAASSSAQEYAINPYRRLFEDLRGRLPAQLTDKNRDLFHEALVYVGAAANGTRRSALSEYCAANLAEIVTQKRKNEQSLRKDQVTQRTAIEIADAKAREAAARNEWPKALAAGFATCQGAYSDAPDQLACKRSVQRQLAPEP